MGQTGLFYCLFSVFSNKHHYNFYKKYIWKNVHLGYGAGIWTHNLWNSSHNHMTRAPTQFLNVLVDKLSYTSSPLFSGFWGYFEKQRFEVKTAVATFW